MVHDLDQSTPDGGASATALDRRRFLALAGGSTVLGALAAALGPGALDALAGAARPTGSSQGSGRTLVLLTLYGGNDGLNTVVPYQDRAYAGARGPLAVDPSKVLPLRDGFGLHPAMTGFKKLWDAKRLAVVHGVGFADPNYSHFESMDIWQSGVPETPVSTGWLGRWLDRTGSDPLRAVAVGPTLPTLLSGERAQGAAIPTGPFVLPGGRSEQEQYAAMAQVSRGEAPLPATAARSAADLLVVQRTLGPILERGGAGGSPGATAGARSGGAASAGALAIADGGGGRSGGNVLATQLSVVANLILGGARPHVYSVELGGFDTHAGQSPIQTHLLGQVDSAVSSFLSAIGDHPQGQGTVVVIYTEFGRRVGANASGGTDHGWANVVLAAGQPVRGGFYGDPPSLSKLSEGNLVYSTDFRAVYATVFDRILGVDPASFLPRSVRALPFV